MKTAILAAALAAALPTLAPAASPEAPLLPMLDAAAVAKGCDEGLATIRSTVAAMAAKPGPGGVLREWNRLHILIEDASGAPDLYATIHPDKAVRTAAEACSQKFVAFNTELFQNEKLFQRLSALKASDPREAKLRRDLLQGFEDSGVSLPPDKRERAKKLFEQIEEHRQAFERNVREDPTKVAFTAEEMAGLPESYLKARKPDAEGRYVLGLDQPSYGPFMANAKSEAARERYYRARFRQGGEANLEHLNQLFLLRREVAALYGLPSFADYGLRRKMAGSPAAVNKFLAEVRAAVTPVEQRELAELRAEKARELGTDPDKTTLRPWDTGYYQERIRRARYDVDQEKLRAYFPARASVEFALRLAEKLYGVRFAESQAPVWHPDVRYFEMRDARGRYLANLYVDVYPRDGKRPGAFAAPIRSASVAAKRTPTAVLVANLERQGLNQRELETLLHELGHALNMTLSNHVRYAPQAISTVKWDFVEAPSQMFEEWARREQSLAVFREVCPECPRLGSDDVRRLEQARRFGEGMGYARQWLLAAYDMELSQRPRAPLEAWKALESATPMGHVEGTMFPTSFRHIAGGYAAGYYGYMWSRVIARDLLTAFEGDLLDPKVGGRYRDTLLGAGNEREESEMVRAFLGRPASTAPFFAEITGKP